MRRLLLLLLAFVLPLQMSWAATHFCDDEQLVAQAVAAAELGDHARNGHDTAEKKSDAKAEKIADACCGAAHGCHGLHHLMGQADPDFVPNASGQTLARFFAAPPLGESRSRIERPKWLAA
jgi:hypothetical protein